MRTNTKLAGTTVDQGRWSGTHTYGEVTTYAEATHKGHTIVALVQVVEQEFSADQIDDPARRHNTYTRSDVLVDGERFSDVPAGTPAQVVKKIAAKLDTIDADNTLRPQLIALISNDDAGTVAPEQVEVGEVAYVYAMGYMRRGIVTKVTKTGAEVAYTTASSAGRIFRKVGKLAELRVEAGGTEPQVAPVEAAAAPLTPAQRANVEAALDNIANALDGAVLDEQLGRVDTPTPARLMVLDGEHAEHLVDAGIDVRRVGRDLYEVVDNGTAAGRVMLGDTSWHGYDLAGTRITGLGVDTLAEAVTAVIATGATPADPHGERARRRQLADALPENLGAPRVSTRQQLVTRLIAGGMGAERAEQVATARDRLAAELTRTVPAIGRMLSRH